MPDQLVLFVSSLVAILLLSLFARAMFPNRFQLTESALAERLPKSYPDEQIEQFLITADHRAAVLSLASGQLCLALQMGNDIAFRLMDNFRWQRQNNRFTIDVRDYTVPAVDFEMEGAAVNTLVDWLEARASVPAFPGDERNEP